MHPFVNIDRKIIFWWTAKCGCTTVKSIMLESMAFDYASARLNADEASVRAAVDRILYRRVGPDGSEVDRAVADFIAGRKIGSVHCVQAGAGLRVSHELASGFTNVLFVRDPFKRFVSGVLDKHIDGSFSYLFRPSSFLDAAKNIGLLDEHHFAPQASDAYLPSLPYARVFDIEDIDYSFLSEILGMRVEPRVMHKKREFSGDCPPSLASATYEELAEIKSKGDVPSYDCFYDEESKGLVAWHYREDFDLMPIPRGPEAS